MTVVNAGVAILAMLAPECAARLAVEDGEAPEQLHVTLGYLAKPATEYPDSARLSLIARLATVTRALTAVATPFAIAQFNPNDPDRSPCAVILVQSDELAALHDLVTEILGDEASATFPIWVPHVTIAYDQGIDVIPEDATTKPVVFDRLVLAWGDQQITLTPTANESYADAFAAGYARATHRYQLPLTDRAKVAYRACTALAEAAPAGGDGPVPTLQLGELEGVWAVIYARREAIEKAHAAHLAGVVKELQSLDWDSVLTQARQWMLLNPTMSTRDLGARVAGAVHDLISGSVSHDTATAWRNVVHSALLDGTAEGQAAALALVADAGHLTINWELAAKEAKAALADNRALWDQTSGWIAQQTQGLGYQIGRRLAALWDQGASREEMEQAIQELLGGDISRTAAGMLLDTAIGQSLAIGAMDTYNAAGVQYVDFETAGDGRVCPTCAQAEDDNSYLMYSAPVPPLHPGCRCTLSPSDYQPTQTTLLQLVGPYQADGEEIDDAA